MTNEAAPDDLHAIFARWPGLAALVALPGPQWRISLRQNGEVCCQRAYEYFVETIYIADDLHVGATRRPIEGRSAPVLAVETFSGTLHTAIAFLARPPHWEGTPRHPG